MKLLLTLYSIFLIIFCVFSYLFVDTNLIYLKPLITGFFLQQRLLVTLTYLVSVVMFFVFYILFIKRIKQGKINLEKFQKIFFVSFIILILSYPAMLSFDIFNYMATAKVLFHYGENPYLIMPNEFTGDPMLLFMHAANKTALYGPFWLLLTGIPFGLGFGSFIFTLILFKLFSAIFYFGVVYLIYKISKNLYWTAFFALNPLVLIETFVSGHNDLAMMFFAILSFYLMSKEKSLSSITSLFLSFLIKFTTLFLFPIYALIFYKQWKNSKVDWERIYFVAGFSMLIIFLLAPLREEIYPWYFIWILTFIPLAKKHEIIKIGSIIFSFCLLLRYIPFMYLGTYFGPTPAIKIAVTFIPVVLYLLYSVFKEKLWLKK